MGSLLQKSPPIKYTGKRITGNRRHPLWRPGIEHTFLQLICGADYHYLARADLGAGRMAFYKLAMHVSLAYAGSCFMLRGFYDQSWAEAFFKGHLAHVLNSL